MAIKESSNMKSKKDKFKFKDTINIIKKSMPYIKKGKKYIFLYAIALIIFISINIITPLFSAKLVLNITNGLLNKVIIVAGVILILELLRNLFDFIASIIYNKFYLTFAYFRFTRLPKGLISTLVK